MCRQAATCVEPSALYLRSMRAAHPCRRFAQQLVSEHPQYLLLPFENAGHVVMSEWVMGGSGMCSWLVLRSTDGEPPGLRSAPALPALAGCGMAAAVGCRSRMPQCLPWLVQRLICCPQGVIHQALPAARALLSQATPGRPPRLPSPTQLQCWRRIRICAAAWRSC